MQTSRWWNPTQPQTLLIGVALLYITGAFMLIFGSDVGLYALAFCPTAACVVGGWVDLLRLALPAAAAAAGFGIANEKKWGYLLGVAVATLPLAARLLVAVRFQVSPLRGDPIGLLFDIALFALLIHPQSRDYQRIWFK